MKISAQQLHVDTTAKTAQLEGYKGGSRQFLRELAADLVKADGTVKSGYLKLTVSGDQVNIKSNHIGGGATAATDLVKKLVQDAYGEKATAALEEYLRGKKKDKVGTLSFVKLIKDLEADTSNLRHIPIDSRLRIAQGLDGASLETDKLDSIALTPEVAELLGTDYITATTLGRGDHEQAWHDGLKKVYGEGNVKVLGRGGEGVAYEVVDQGVPHIYKGYRYAPDLMTGTLGAREGDIGAAYSKTLLASPHLAAPSHYILGTGKEGSVPETVLKLPAARVKDLVKAARQGELPDGLRLFGVLMPKATGTSINQVPGSLTDRQTSQIASGLYKGLTDLAAHRAIHNDIKPENVIMDPDSGAIKLIDFGGLQKLSKSADRGSPLGSSQGAMAETPAYRAPWIDGGVRFGPEVDRYAFGVTLLASVVKDVSAEGAVQAAADNADMRRLENALTDFRRPPERPEALLDDVLDRIRSQDAPLHDRLQRHLETRPQFRDFLQKLFASSCPGEGGDLIWANLDEHPFLEQQALWANVKRAGLDHEARLHAHSTRKMSFMTSATADDFRRLNAMAASALAEAVYADPGLLDPSLNDAQRTSRYKAFEQRRFDERLAHVDKSLRAARSVNDQENLRVVRQDLIDQRQPLMEADLRELQDPGLRQLMQRTLVTGRAAGLTLRDVMTMGRGQVFAIRAGITPEQRDQLLNRLINGQELGNADDVRKARFLFEAD